MAIQSQPSRISEPFAGSGTKNTIPATNSTPSASQAASWASGFPPECSQPISAGGCPVPRNDMNGVLNWLSQGFAFKQDGGIWEWSALADYDLQRMVRGSNGKLYWSVAQSGPNLTAGAQDPTTDNGTYWQLMPMNDASVVHKTGNEDIYGVKTFFNNLVVSNDGVDVTFIESNSDEAGITSGYTTISSKTSDLYKYAFIQMGNSATQRYVALSAFKPGQHTVAAEVSLRYDSDNSQFFFPSGTNSLDNMSLGSGGHRWKDVYAVNGSIQTSDARFKTEPETIPDAVLDAWGDVKFVQFQMVAAVAAKGGSKARLHSGLIAQRIGEVFSSHGLDASRYGLFCHDQWPAEPESGMDAGDSYALRYEEALCMEAAFQRRRADRVEARIAELEERLAAIEAKLG